MANSKVKKNSKTSASTKKTKKSVSKKVTKTTKGKTKKTVTKAAKHSNSWVQYPIIAFIAIAVGVGAGAFVKRSFGQEEIDYSNFDAGALAADAKELLEMYEANPKANFSPADLVNIGLEKYRQCENSYSFTVGVAETVVDQSIRNAQIKNGDKYFEEQISRSKMVSLANRYHYTKDSEAIDEFKGKAQTDETATFTSDKKSYTNDEFKNYMGKTLQDMFVYTISNDTIFDDSTVEELPNGNKRIYLNLDPNLATYYYKIQMKNMSDLDSLPTFNYVKHTYTFSSDMTLLHCYIDEKYQASMGMTVSIQNKLHSYYHANEYRAIPEFGESFDYSTEGEITYE